MNKRNLYSNSLLALCLVGVMLLAACGQASTDVNQKTGDELETANQSDFMWQIAINGYEQTEELNTTGTTTLYDGTVEDVPYVDKPQTDKSFILLNLTINKSTPGNVAFDWKDVVLVSESGKEYTRHENDSFLSNHQYDRLPATNLKLGEAQGWICFEVDSDEIGGKLWFLHKAQEGDNSLQIK